MAPSTVKAEYVASCSTSCQAVWLRELLYDLFDLQMDSTCIYCDNHRFVKLLSDASLDTIDAMVYHQMIGSLMCLTNKRLDICLAVNTLS